MRRSVRRSIGRSIGPSILAIFALAVAAAAPAAEPGAKPGTAKDKGGKDKGGKVEARAAKPAGCPSCKFACEAGTTNCWACGTCLPASPLTRKLPSIQLPVVRVIPEAKRAGTGAQAGPEAAYEEAERWIGEHSDDHDGALKRLDELAEKVRGTALESLVRRRTDEILALKAKANRPRTPEERMAEVVGSLLKVKEKIRRTPKLHKENVLELKKLLKLAKGTPYEGAVQKMLDKEKAKLGSGP